MWKATKSVLPEEGVPVETMIADEHGVRNEAVLKFQRRLNSINGPTYHLREDKDLGIYRTA